MTVQINAYDPDNNGIGIYFDQYLNQKFAAFDGVAGVLSADTNATGYAFIGPDGGGIVFHSNTGWTVDPLTGQVIGELTSISFGQQTTSNADGSFTQTTEMRMSGLEISPADLQRVFDQAADGEFDYLYDSIRGEQFFVEGSSSKDSLVGGSAGSTIYGGAGDDRIYGRGENGASDRLFGGDGNDKVVGGDGGDFIYGENGDDKIYGAGGEDILKGGSGKDYIYGGDGSDKLYGGSGDDGLMGGSQEDRLYGGTGNDFLHGGLSADTFIFQKNAGRDTIADFKPGKAGKDLIIFQGTDLHSFSDVIDHAKDTPRGVVITYDEGTLLLADVRMKYLDSHDFYFL